MTPLCTADDVKAYLDKPDVDVDDLLDGLIIPFVSAEAVREAQLADREDGLDPTFFDDAYTEHYDGTNSQILLLRHNAPGTPVSVVSAVRVNDLPIPPSATALGSGFVFDRFTVRLRGVYRFWRGMQNVLVSYRAGFGATSATASALKLAAAEWAALVFQTRKHIDVRAKTLDRETTTYLTAAMPDRMRGLLTTLRGRMAA